MAEQVLPAVAASPGAAAGAARVLDSPAGPPQTLPEEERAAEAELVGAALNGAAAELARVAERLRCEGREEEAEIVETGVLMAGDPALLTEAEAAVRHRGRPAPAALTEAAEKHARAIAALDDETLAARADDVRSLGRRAARLARALAAASAGEPDRTAPAGEPAPTAPTRASAGEPGRAAPTRVLAGDPADVVVVARDLGPADVAELGPEVRGVALAAGGVTAHAAIVARSLGLPMAVGAGEELLRAPEGAPIVVDGSAGIAVLGPAAPRLELARAAIDDRERARARAREQSNLVAVTDDGRRVRVLANAVTPAEVRIALEAGAEGAGLIRTELAFLEARDWPSEHQHRAALTPVLTALAGTTATVRVLDFGGDKTPPFLHGKSERGVELLLERPDVLAAQLRAALAAGRDCELRLLLPMVSAPEQVRAVRELACEAMAAVGGVEAPLLGAMVELPVAVDRAAELAAEVDFLSIGTNDLSAEALGRDRFSGETAPAHDPRVLGLIARTLRAARAAGVPVEVCGEAASDPICVPLLVGLGADELSAGAARVGTVRAWVRDLSFAQTAELAERALAAFDAESVERLVRPLGLGERGFPAGERGEAA
jgi:phosphoenolpyruvate-protein kinase (PTS system EI component)